MDKKVSAKVPGAGVIKDHRVRDESGKVIGRLTEQSMDNEGVLTVVAEIDDPDIIEQIKGRHQGFSIGTTVPKEN